MGLDKDDFNQLRTKEEVKLCMLDQGHFQLRGHSIQVGQVRGGVHQGPANSNLLTKQKSDQVSVKAFLIAVEEMHG